MKIIIVEGETYLILNSYDIGVLAIAQIICGIVILIIGFLIGRII